MKRVLVTILCFVIALSLTACGEMELLDSGNNTQTSTISEQSDNDITQQQSGNIYIGYPADVWEEGDIRNGGKVIFEDDYAGETYYFDDWYCFYEWFDFQYSGGITLTDECGQTVHFNSYGEYENWYWNTFDI